MKNIKLSEVMQNRYFDFQTEVRAAQSKKGMIQCLVRHLDRTFKVEGIGVVLGKRVGAKFLVEEELVGDSFPIEKDFSDVSIQIKNAITSMVVTTPPALDPEFVFNVSGIAYQVLELFENDKQVHLLYFKELKGMRGNSDLEVFLDLFKHEWNWLQKLDQAHKLIYRDDLTGIFNYRFLDENLDREVMRSERFNESFSLMFIDLDDFKSVNDTHGHLVGSELLCRLAEVIRRAVREVDSVIRYGGDEFIVMLLGANTKDAKVVAERVRRGIENYTLRIENQKEVKVTASIGLSTFPEHGSTKEELLSSADSGMYKSKGSGKNCIRIQEGNLL